MKGFLIQTQNFVLNSGSDTIICFRLHFVLNIGLLPPVSTMGLGWIHFLVFHFPNTGIDANELESIYYNLLTYSMVQSPS